METIFKAGCSSFPVIGCVPPDLKPLLNSGLNHRKRFTLPTCGE